VQDEKARAWFEKHGLTPPSTTPHGVTPDNIAEKLRPLKVHSWRLEGNRLVAKTDMGDVVNHISPEYVMTGVDTNNLPIFKKL
jgi:hypothetical protein